MKTKVEYTRALKENIASTYTYAYAKNAYACRISADLYDPVEFFNRMLEEYNPFFIFMKLQGYGFKRTEAAIRKYDIYVTEEDRQEAKFELEVIEKIVQRRSDVVKEFFGDRASPNVVQLSENEYTTKDTVDVKNFMDKLPESKETNNYFYEDRVSSLIKNSEEQMNAVKVCLKNKVSCLIGGAGTGKSFVTAEIIRQLKHNGKKVEVLAPTHKAKNALQEKLDGEVRVRTINSFIWGRETGSDVIIIDESGMISTPLMAGIARGYRGQQLIFVGDKNQLEPVEYGRPFEYLQANFQVAELKDNKRAEAADIVELGKELLGLESIGNVELTNVMKVDSVEEAIKQGAEVVITFKNENVRKINELRRIKNGEETIAEGFSVGDEIIAKVNEDGIYNGDLFTITGYNTAVRKGDKKIVNFKSEKDLAARFDLAYALTVHKSQGSEWDVVAYQPSYIDTANLAYVAVTRAKKKLIVIGELNESYPLQREWRHLE